MKKFNLVGQCFGRKSEYKRALFTIYSFLAFQEDFSQFRVILYTDNIDFFKNKFSEIIEVHYEFLSTERVKEMRGVNDFLHRMKIALIEHTFLHYDGKMLYVDSDTFFIDNPNELIEKISESISSMHKDEYEFSSMLTLKRPAGDTFIAFAELIRDHKFSLSDNSLLRIPLTDHSWNAGVMIFHPFHVRFIKDVYTLTEQFYPPTLNHASEQYAFSVMLQKNTQILPSEQYIYHYWYRVEKTIMDIFLNTFLSDKFFQLNFNDRISQTKNTVKTLTQYLHQHLLMYQDNAIQAFNTEDYKNGYKYTFKSLLIKPIDMQFTKDVLYHTKKILKGQK